MLLQPTIRILVVLVAFPTPTCALRWPPRPYIRPVDYDDDASLAHPRLGRRALRRRDGVGGGAHVLDATAPRRREGPADRRGPVPDVVCNS